MKQDHVAKRYATAVFELAKEQNAVEQMKEELQVVVEVVENTNLFDTFFKHPKITSERKKELVKASFQGKISDTLLSTLFLLIDKKREGILFKMAEEFLKLSNEEQGIAEAKVFTAKPLTDAEKVAFSATFSKVSGKGTLTIENIVEPELIGGFKVRIGDRIYDGSVLSQLRRIERRMISGNVSR
ncbi:F0F1 ATP synthase subunit delta [Anaerobacillus alkalilacustris]|uniref:ATP synthase subunit delta n=1 Tax=Anaerobacillus alkalilacustris TaxID=393763 RepID=A0A1S2LJU2_9BACI|nr:F0F1 ATP synthase subunit delta [Anaerobacillus alkalilacustris]OIJ11745.1 F0F1 ATP synthase subunit delta [Anaerobacillus alkalilacustris]